MTLLLGSLTIGLSLSLLALGVFISFRVFNFPDITADGSLTTGAAIAAVLMVGGVPPLLATLAAMAGGFVAGAVTGVLHARFRINGLLAGILVMIALYSINLRIMGKSNLPLLSTETLASQAARLGERVLGSADVIIAGWSIGVRDLSDLAAAFGVVAILGFGLYAFFRTQVGAAMRATGDNPQMIRALGVDVGRMMILGLALSNALIALAGALLAQYQGFADVQMGIGMVVLGLASVIIGESLVGVWGGRGLGLLIAGAAMGSVFFRLLVAIALRAGLNPNDLKLVTALFVFSALVLPGLGARLRKRRA